MSRPRPRLQDNFVLLCNELNLELIVPVLRQEKMLTSDEHERLLNPSTPIRTRREMLLLYMPKKGRDHFENFTKCLVWSGQKELAKRIGVDLSTIPDPPPNFTAPQPGLDQQQQVFRMLQTLLQSTQPHNQPPSYAPVYQPPQLHEVLQSSPSPAPPPNPSPAPLQSPLSPPPSYQTSQPPPQPPPQPLLQPPPQPPPQPLPSQPTTSQDILRASGPPPQVFILYNKEDRIPNLSPDDYCAEVLELADLLNQCGGLVCEVDMYDKHNNIPNWSTWTEQMIRNSHYVILVCSQTMADHFKNPGHQLVSMSKGVFYSDSIFNYIAAPKFIPVFLNQQPINCLQLMPTNLHTSLRYHLKMRKLTERLGDTDGMPSTEFTDHLSALLQDAEFVEIARLIAHLRGEAFCPPPAQPSAYVKLPQQVHVQAPSHGYSSQPKPPPSNPLPSASQSAEFISDDDLQKIAERLPHDWQHLGIKLGVQYSVLESFRTAHSPKRAAMEMLKCWQKTKSRAATRKKLKEALEKLGYGRLANEVFGKDK